MISLVISLVLMSLYLFSIVRKEDNLFSACLTLLILFHDILFVTVKGTVPEILYYAIKSWQEILTVFGLVLFVRSGKKPGWIGWVLIGLILYGLLRGITLQTKAFEMFKGFRMYLLFFTGLILFYQTSYFNKINIKLVFTIFIAFTTASALYSFWIDAIFVKDLRVLWFYDFVNQINPIELARYNYIRDGGLRACGLLISPLIQSILLGFSSLVLSLFILKRPKAEKKLWIIVLLGIQIAGLYLCRTRIGWFVLGGGLLLALLHFYHHRLTLYQAFLFPVCLIVMTLFILIFGFTNDPSALGRIPQYIHLFSDFNWFGLGFGHPSTLTYFDSMYISAGLTFGITGLLYMSIPVMACALLHAERKKYQDVNQPESLFFAAAYGFSFILLYVFAFQFTLGSPTVLMFYFLVYAFLLNNKVEVQSPVNG